MVGAPERPLAAPCIRAQSRGDGGPRPGAATAPGALGQELHLLWEKESHRPRQGRECFHASGVSGIWEPWVESPGAGRVPGSHLSLPVAPAASVGGEFLPLRFLAPIGRSHLGSVGRQARRWPWGGGR